MRTGVANFTLDYGKAPRWLIERMVKLGRIIGIAIVEEFGTEEFVKRLSDPVWFQSFGCVLAFDWNASGLTTTTMGALKEAFRGLEQEFGIYICGGKGKTSRKTPDEILGWGLKTGLDENKTGRLVFASRAAAKTDSSLIQDGFQIYHHNFIFTPHLVGNQKGAGQARDGVKWAVIQQGMNTAWLKARRYHWFGDLTLSDFINEPHSGIASQAKLRQVLNLTSGQSEKNRSVSAQLAGDRKTLVKDINLIQIHSSRTSSLFENDNLKILNLTDNDFRTHRVMDEKIDFESPHLKKSFNKIFTEQPKTFQDLMMVRGVGAKTIRALSLVAEIIYGAKPSYEDPARYSFAHGGKDHIPYPVDRAAYDKTIDIMSRAVRNARALSLKERDSALSRIDKIS